MMTDSSPQQLKCVMSLSVTLEVFVTGVEKFSWQHSRAFGYTQAKRLEIRLQQWQRVYERAFVSIVLLNLNHSVFFRRNTFDLFCMHLIFPQICVLIVLLQSAAKQGFPCPGITLLETLEVCIRIVAQWQTAGEETIKVNSRSRTGLHV